MNKEGIEIEVENKPLSPEIITAAPTSINYLLGRSVIEGPRLTFGDEQLHAYSVPLDDGSIYYCAVINYPVNTSKLFNFLDYIAPVSGMDRRSILADWKMPVGTSRQDITLQKLHASLGESMQEFERHREFFYETLRYNSLASLSAEASYLWDFDHENTIEFWSKNGRFIDAFIGERIIESSHSRQFNPALREYRKIISLSEDKARAKRFDKLFKNMSPDERRQVLDGYNSTATVIFSDDLPGTILRHHESTNLNVILQEDRSIEITENNSGKCIVKNENNAFVANYYYTNFLIPVIQWRTDKEGNRNLDFSFLHEGPLASRVNDFVEGFNLEGLMFDSRRLSPLLGLLTAAYIEPDIPAKWPKEVGLSDSKQKQEMGSAQVPVLAYMRKKEISRTPLLSAVEEYLKK